VNVERGDVREYGLRDVERLLNLSRAVVVGLIRSGYVAPERGPRGAYRFSFRDLIALRTARSLASAHLAPRRINRVLKDLRLRLPASMPLSGLAIRAFGDRIVVQEGVRHWEADSGQYMLDLEVRISGGELHVFDRPERTDTTAECAEDWFQRAWEAEPSDPEEAVEGYQQALRMDPGHAAASINLGRLLHESDRLKQAEETYRSGLCHHPEDELLLFNFAVLLEDLGRLDEAAAAYRAALRSQPAFADCHYNLALLCESTGNKLGAIRHLREYRKLVAREG
jgi:tetratricopeptide (TPR) repeat protein